jgi:hypothetical protein
MNLETKITIYKFTPQLFTLTRNNPMFCNMNMVYFSLFAVLLV